MDSTYGIEAGGRENGKDSKGKEAAWEENGRDSKGKEAAREEIRRMERIVRERKLRGKRSGELKG